MRPHNGYLLLFIYDLAHPYKKKQKTQTFQVLFPHIQYAQPNASSLGDTLARSGRRNSCALNGVGVWLFGKS